MRLLKHLLFLCLLWFVPFSQSGFAENAPLQMFTANSYQKILQAHKNTPFIVIIWSINCPSCLEEMQLLSEFHERYPHLKIIMVATDTQAAGEQIRMYLDQYQLTDVENWLFEEQDSEIVRRTIDKAWHGEVPRSYFFKPSGVRQGLSGLLTREDFQKLVQELIR